MDSAFPIWWFGVLGLIVGSFLNVLIARLRTGEAWIGGRSRCPRCRHSLTWYDNIPLVSFAILRGRCRHCRAPISWQYPAVELLTAILFILSASVLLQAGGSDWMALGTLLVVQSVLIVILVYDFLHMEIPLGPWWVGLAAAGGLLFLRGGDPSLPTAWFFLEHLLAGLGGALFLGTLSFVSREQWMGWGDAYLIFLLGLLAGFPGVLWTVTLGSGLGALVGIGLILLGRKALGSRLPFGPFLILGFWLVFFWERFSPGTAPAAWLTGWL